MGNFQNKWTEEELALLWTFMPNEDIAEQIGRTVSAVESKRYQVTGYYTHRTLLAQARKIPPRERHLYALAEQLGVKIGG